ncbi:GntR family transcriptional regulator [Mucilaginibacter sp. S1162]|uniref:GntR family transcriptional regulator n=1 Tax=Mucilaginibacter humi TaxID=2732510 RepID=A0ABX1W2N6_9SPHI|nr:GntR family transcriptional regulator [Mucilaginibacter humi]NNU34487.1 GntR family transcriptional regulator [Mucilaginibacter humi]
MNFKDKEAIYLQIADYVSEHISLGKWQPGEKIPSVRDLATSLQVNPNTVMRTYEHLQQLEIVFNKRGLGLFVGDDAINRIQAIRKERFMQQELPEFFNSLYLLGIGPEEILKHYQDFKKTKNLNHENK